MPRLRFLLQQYDLQVAGEFSRHASACDPGSDNNDIALRHPVLLGLYGADMTGIRPDAK